MKPVLIFVICALSLLAGDFVWLSLTGETLYRPEMHGLMRTQPDLWPAAGFYLLYVLALCVLILYPATDSGGPVNHRDITVKAGVLGLAAFGTYDLTGLSVIRGWPVGLSVIDMAWGALNSVIAVNITALVLRLLGQVGKASAP